MWWEPIGYLHTYADAMKRNRVLNGKRREIAGWNELLDCRTKYSISVCLVEREGSGSVQHSCQQSRHFPGSCVQRQLHTHSMGVLKVQASVCRRRVGRKGTLVASCPRSFFKCVLSARITSFLGGGQTDFLTIGLCVWDKHNSSHAYSLYN